MSSVPRDVSDEQLLSIVRGWLDILAKEDYAAVFAGLGYALSQGRPGPQAIQEDIRRYRSPELYPGVDTFVVTDWRKAQGGNPNPLQLIRRYKDNSMRLKATVELDLPLNGRWSDLEADFVVFDSDKGSMLGLEEIGSSVQRQRDLENAE